MFAAGGINQFSYGYSCSMIVSQYHELYVLLISSFLDSAVPYVGNKVMLERVFLSPARNLLHIKGVFIVLIVGVSLWLGVWIGGSRYGWAGGRSSPLYKICSLSTVSR